MSRRFFRSTALLALLILLVAQIAFAAPPGPASEWRDKVDAWVLGTAAAGQSEFLVFLADQATLEGATSLRTKAERGAYVYQMLSQHAERTQGPLRRALDRLGVAYRPFWIANMIWVRGELNVVQALAERSDVAHIYANPQVKLDLDEMTASNAALLSQPEAIEWNILKVNANDVWAAGVNGAGAVVGGQDTGYRWTHAALKGKYRGWNGTTADHNYNWHDAIHVGGSNCGADSPTPCDDNGHGTHTMGTMVGDDGSTNQIGVAPGAKWIGCRNMNENIGAPATYAECYEWFVAPTRIDGTGADPSKAPDVINNSWGCPPSEGCTDPNALLTVVQNVRAAGIVTVHSAGNDGPSCSTVSDPAAIYAESFSVGATNDSDAIASFSSRGPVTIDGSGRMKPNVSAPGVGVRSSTAGSDTSYGSMSGTSMAGPHVAGLVALVIDANEALRGEVDALEGIIEQSAVDLITTQGCGSDSSTAVPNNVYGWGRVDAYVAYLQAIACTAPEAITDLAITQLDSTQVTLDWSAKAGAMVYHLWWNASPFFTPGASCAGSIACTVVNGTNATQTALGDTSVNNTWLVQPVAACGAVQAAASNRVGEFDYGLIKGAP